MRKSLTLSILLTAALGCSALVMAAPGGQEGGPGGPGGPGGHGGWHGHSHGGGALGDLHKLNLTDAQKASIKQIMQSSFSQSKSQFQAVHQQRQALDAMTPDAAGYQAAAASLAQAEAAATSARITQRAAIDTQIYALLTSAQKSQLATDKANHAAREQQWQEFKAQHPVTSSSSAQ